jgi:hypothetical protein
MARIVISYRRSDSEAMTGRIYDCLVDHYGEKTVFRDLDSVPVGKDYRRQIEDAIRRADLVLAIVGPKWSGPKRRGGSRIKEAKDTVRAEVEEALKRGVPIVPILVHDAEMPEAAELPSDIREFAYQNAATIDAGQDFRAHMDRLLAQTDRILAGETPGKVNLRQFWKPGLRRGGVPLGIALASIAGVAGLAGFWFLAGSREDQAAKRASVAIQPAAWAPPANRSYWQVDKSLVYLESAARERQFILVEPSRDMEKAGAKPGSLIFEGEADAGTTRYAGRLYTYFGKCGPLPYAAEGPVAPGPEIVLTGMAPRVNMVTCERIGETETTLTFKFKERK